MLNELEILVASFISAGLVGVSQYLMKKHIGKLKPSLKGIVSLLHNKGVLIGLATLFCGALFYLLALSSGDLDFVYPISESAFIFVLIISAVMFKERISKKRILGVLLILLGITIIALTF